MKECYRNPHFIAVIDTETANTHEKDMDDVLFYDLGAAVVDLEGKVYETFSFVNSDIFFREPYLMENAYYKDKIPLYMREIKEGKRVVATTAEIRRRLLATFDKFGIKVVCAHNARFDVKAMNNTRRYVTKSKSRYFLPPDVDVWDSTLMAKDTILKDPRYIRFIEKNNLFTPTGKLPFNAEILYRFITNDTGFSECHTGLEDVLIESKIVAYCHTYKDYPKRVLYEHYKPQNEDEDDLPF